MQMDPGAAQAAVLGVDEEQLKDMFQPIDIDEQVWPPLGTLPVSLLEFTGHTFKISHAHPMRWSMHNSISAGVCFAAMYENTVAHG